MQLDIYNETCIVHLHCTERKSTKTQSSNNDNRRNLTGQDWAALHKYQNTEK